VARHLGQVPAFLYEPPKRPLRGVGEVIGRLPAPGDIEHGGAMHRIPALQWQTWVRLAFVEPGKDWRCLNALAVQDGYLRDFAIQPEAAYQKGVLGVRHWEDRTGVVAGRSSPTNGAYSVADPRVEAHPKSVQLGVRSWSRAAPAIKTDVSVGTGPYAVADPRMAGPRFNNIFRIVPMDGVSPAVSGPGGPAGGLAVADPSGGETRHVNGKYRITGYDQASNAVIAASTTGNGACGVADPRTGYGPNAHRNKLRVVGADAPAPTVTTSDRVGSGALAIADPRPACLRPDRPDYRSQGHYGIVPWNGPSKLVSASACVDNGAWSVADPRPEAMLPALGERLVCVIIARDGTWHRPFTSLELAVLQNLVDPDNPLGFLYEGKSESAFREHVGNAIPPAAATAFGGEALRTLLMAEAGETFRLSDTPIWVRQLAVALSVDLRQRDAAL